jgi:hypothetical protein
MRKNIWTGYRERQSSVGLKIAHETAAQKAGDQTCNRPREWPYRRTRSNLARGSRNWGQ